MNKKENFSNSNNNLKRSDLKNNYQSQNNFNGQRRGFNNNKFSQRNNFQRQSLSEQIKEQQKRNFVKTDNKKVVNTLKFVVNSENIELDPKTRKILEDLIKIFSLLG